jgi:hypothetical protein
MSSKNEIVHSNESKEPKGDPEMAAIYLKRLMPVFCNTFQSTMLPSIRLFYFFFFFCEFKFLNLLIF